MGKLNDLVRDSLENTPGVDPAINSKLVRRYERHLRRSGSQKSDRFEMTVQGVERYRRSSIIRRFGAVAAAMALIVTIGGGTLLMYRAAPDDHMTDHSSSDKTSDTENEPQYDHTANSYDMSTKEGIYNKMVNSCFFFTKFSGTIIESADIENNLCSMIDINLNVASGRNSAISQTYMYTNDIYNIVAGDDPLIDESTYQDDYNAVYCDGEKIANIYPNEFAYEIVSENASPQSGHPVAFEAMMDYEKNKRKSASPFSVMKSGINTVIGERFSQPYTCDVFSYMSDFNNWSIDGDSFICDRECVGISLTISDRIRSYMNIDKNTGCMLRYIYEVDGKVADYMVMREVFFDDDASEIEEVDLREFHQYDESQTAYVTNSNGMTYGSRGQNRLCVQDFDNLPALIAYGKTSDGRTRYINKEEFMNDVGCEIVLNMLHTAENRYDADVLVYTLNLYDPTGENVIDTIDYYCSEKDYEHFMYRDKYCYLFGESEVDSDWN